MKAIVLAAGRGSRLGGLTDSRSKVMLPVAGRPIIEWMLSELADAGVKEATIVHGYAGSRILTNLGSGKGVGLKLKFVEQTSPHGSLGAALDALSAMSLDEDVLILNGDNIVSSSAIKRLIQSESASLLVAEHENPQEYGVVTLNGDVIEEIQEKPALHEAVGRVVSTGALRCPVLWREIFEKTVKTGLTGIPDAIRNLLEEDVEIKAIRTDTWVDVDHPWDLIDMNTILLHRVNSSISPAAEIHPSAVLSGNVHISEGCIIRSGTVIEGPVHIGPNCDIGPMAVVTGSTTIAAGTRIGPFCRIRSSFLMEDVQVDSGSWLQRSVIGPATVLRSHINVDVGETQKIGTSGEIHVRRLGLVTGEACTLGHGVVTAPGTILGSQVVVERRSRVSGEHPSGAEISSGGV